MKYAPNTFEGAMFMFICLGVPGVVCVAMSSGMRSDERQRRSGSLVVIGMRRRDLLVVDFAETVPSVVCGSLAALICVALLLTVDIPLPWLDTTFQAAQTRQSTGFLLGAVAGGAVLSGVIVLAVRAASRFLSVRAGRRPEGVRGEVRSDMRILVGLAGFAIAIIGPILMPEFSYQPLFYYIGVILVALSLPALVARFVTRAGESLAILGLRGSRARDLVSGRYLEALSGRSSRLAFGICVAILIGGQMQLWTTIISGYSQRALEARDTWGSRVVQVEGQRTFGPLGEGFLALLPEDVGPVFVSGGGSGGGQTITASCPALMALDLECSPHVLDAAQVPEIVYLVAPFDFAIGVEVMPLEPGSGSEGDMLSDPSIHTVLVSLSGTDIDVDALRREAIITHPAFDFSSIGESAALMAGQNDIKGNWVLTVGLIGVAVIMAFFAACVGVEARSTAARLAPVGVVAGAPSLASRTAWLTTCLPVLIAGVLGVGAYLLLPAGLDNRLAGWQDSDMLLHVSPEFIGGSLVLTVVVALWAGWSASRATKRAAAAWRP